MIKKKRTYNTLKWLKDVGLKATAVFLIVGAGFYAYAAVTWPNSEPNPVTGVVGMFVGASSKSYTVQLGYKNAGKYCSDTFTGSHICTPDEMANSINHGDVTNAPIFNYTGSDLLWINSGPPGYVKYVVNDCSGWKVKDSTAFGSVWDLKDSESLISPCSKSRAFACCK